MKRIFALALALCLLLSMGGFPAFAEDEAEPGNPPTEGESSGGTDPSGEEPGDPDVPGEDGQEPGEDPEEPGEIAPEEEQPEEEAPEEEQPVALTFSLVITCRRQTPSIYRIYDTEENELLRLILANDAVLITGLPEGSYTVQEIDGLSGGYLDTREFSLSQEQEETTELVFGGEEESRGVWEMPWLRDTCIHH